MGIEPTRPAWKAGILPLNYTRISTYSGTVSLYRLSHFTRFVNDFFRGKANFSSPSGYVRAGAASRPCRQRACSSSRAACMLFLETKAAPNFMARSKVIAPDWATMGRSIAWGNRRASTSRARGSASSSCMVI